MQKTEAIQYFGGAQKLATALGLKSRQAIYAWPDEVPDRWQYKIHHMSGGVLQLSERLEQNRAQ